MKNLTNLNTTNSPRDTQPHSRPITPPLLERNVSHRSTGAQSDDLSFPPSPVPDEGERETIIRAPDTTPTQGTRQGMPPRILLTSVRNKLDRMISEDEADYTSRPLIFEREYNSGPPGLKRVFNPVTGLYENRDEFRANTNNSSRLDQEPSGGFSVHEERSPSPSSIPINREGSPPLQFAFSDPSKRKRTNNQ